MTVRDSSHLLFVVGTRPEAIKLAPIILEWRARGRRATLCATGQHRELFDDVLTFFDLKADFDFRLLAPRQSPSDIVAGVLPRLADILAQTQADRVVVQGDTASAFAGALAAFYAHIPVAHVEAGLRSGCLTDPFPEEMHRRQIATLADLHFSPTPGASAFLRDEGVALDRIFETGNSGVDALHMALARLDQDAALEAGIRARFAFLDPARPLVLATVHRTENRGPRLQGVIAALRRLAMSGICQILLPLHPHPDVSEPIRAAFSGDDALPDVHLLPPLDYPTFTWALRESQLVLTDSGGVQEEAPSLGRRVLVLRDRTERHEGVASGQAFIVGVQAPMIVEATRALLQQDRAASGAVHIPRALYGDGGATARIVDILANGSTAADAAPPFVQQA